MNGSDKYLSMSLDQIIKIRKRQGSSRATSSATTSQSHNRGTPNQRSQRGNRANFNQQGQRGYVQQRGGGTQSLRGRQRGTQRGAQRGSQRGSLSQRGYRGSSQRGGLRARSSHQTFASQRGRSQQQQLGGVSAWSSYQSLASTQTRGSARGRARASPRQSLGTRGGAKLRRVPVRTQQQQQQQQLQRPRGPLQLNPMQLARNRVRLAAQILVQRRQQLQQIETQGQGPPLRGVSALRRRGGVYRGRGVPAASFAVRGGTRQGALVHKIAARASLVQKMARARRSRQPEVPQQMLSVSIENERALAPAPAAYEIPQLMVINHTPADPFAASLFQVPTVVHRRGRGGVQRQLAASLVLEPEMEEEQIAPFPATPGRRLTLHERFSQC